MSNESLKRVFEKLLNLKGKDGKPGHILCLAAKENDENSTEEHVVKSIDLKLLKESYKKPLYAMGCRKRKRASENELTNKRVEINFDLKQNELQEKTRERYFASLATKGVVQLFNAISSHQKEIKVKLNEAGKSETKKEKVISSTSKGNFIQRLNTKATKKTYMIEASL